MADIAVRYLHFLSFITLFAMVVAQHLLLKGSIESHWLKKVAVLDAVYGAAALLVLVFGMGLWFWVGKPADYYTYNWVFHLKITLFVITAALSFIPTRFVLKQRKSLVSIVDVPKSIIMVIRTQLLLLLIIVLLAVMMANGVGYKG